MTAKRGRSRRRIAAIALALTATLGLALEGARFLQLDADLQEARSALREAVTIVERVGPAATAEDVAAIADDISQADGSLGRARGTLDNDPLLAILRVIPPVAAQIDGASRMASATQRLTSEHHDIARLMERYVEIRDGSTGRDRMADLITFAADEKETIGSVLVAIQDAAAEMSGLSDVDLIGPLAAARTELLQYLDQFGQMAESTRPLLRAVPSLFGVGTPRRYLVLALDNAELRPVGGLIAAFATVRIEGGRLGSLDFRDIAEVDRADQITYVPPPVPLQDHLLGDFTWQVADAGWWPDFARSAGEARHLYAIETGDNNFDGVIAFTPDLVDALIGVTGPVDVPGTGITVGPGEAYIHSLEEAEILNIGPTRKRFLGDLASAVIRRVEQLPPDRYPALVEALASAIDHRQIQILPDDLASRTSMIRIGAYTPFTFPEGGDRLAIMGSNVAPVSKLDALLDMSHELDVRVHADGSADERLTTTYVNRFGPDLPPDLARVARSFSTGNLGTYERRYLAPAAEVLSVRSAGSDAPVTDPETLEMESGCLVVGNYLFVRPGQVELETTYHTPQIVQRRDGAGGEWVYRLDFRKQPGRDHDGLTVRVTIPDGARLTGSSEGGVAIGSVVSFSTTTLTDQLFEVTFAAP